MIVLKGKDGEADVFQSGEIFRNYVIERLLGKGGLGEVYLARHAVLDTLYALKVLYPGVASQNANYVKRFLREAKLASRIRHPNLVAVHDCGHDEERDLYFLVMDYVAGGDLRSALAFAGRFEPQKAATIVAQVASALAAAQRFHVVHRDIKPENIMLQPDGLVKLVDLGIAKSDDFGDQLKTMTASVLGTPVYVSPEQATDAAGVDERSDIYSLGIVFFEMVAGRCPYCGANSAKVLAQVLSDEPMPDVRDYAPSVPDGYAVLIRRMCVKDRARRIASSAALLEELAKLGVRPVATSAVGVVEYTPSGKEAQKTALGIDLNKLPANNPTLSFETQDEEILAFVEGLKRRRSRRRLTWLVAAVAAGVLGVALVVWLCAA